MPDEVLMIPLAEIRENPVALRGVARESEDFKKLTDSVRRHGLFNAISVVRKETDKNGAKDGRKYEVLDGLHRYTAALEAGLGQLPALVRTADQQGVAIGQMIANLHKIETKPIDYTRQLLRILAANPTMTEAELAGELSQSPTFINQRLKLTKLKENVAKLVNEGQIVLQNAYALAKMDHNMQEEWVARAIAEKPENFVTPALKAAKDAAEAKKGAAGPKSEEFVAVPILRKLAEIKDELAKPTVTQLIVKEVQPKTAEEAFLLGAAWAVNMDPTSQAVAKQKWQERKKQEADEKAKRQAERDAKARQANLVTEAKATAPAPSMEPVPA